MGETRQPTTNPANPPTTEATREEPKPAPSTTTRAPTSSSTSAGQKCEVLRDSCKKDAKFKAIFPTGSETYTCEDHKQMLIDNYPEYELVFEEV